MFGTVRDAGPRFWMRSILWSLGVALALGIPTVMVDTPLFRRMTAVDPWQYPVWVLSALAAGIALAARRLPQNASCTLGGRTVSGAGAAYLAIGCPICNKLVVAAVGVSGALRFFAPLQPLLAVLSLGLLIMTLRRLLRPPAPGSTRMIPQPPIATDSRV